MLPEEPPSAPPKNIVASGRTNQSIMVQWQPPPETEHNGVLRGYILRQVACVWPFLDCRYKESGVCIAGIANSKVCRSPTVIKRIRPVSYSREWWGLWQTSNCGWPCRAASAYPTIARPCTYQWLHFGRRMKRGITSLRQAMLFIPNLFFLFQFLPGACIINRIIFN